MRGRCLANLASSLPRWLAQRIFSDPAARGQLEQILHPRIAEAWRAEVAREHNLPAYVIFHDATLAAIAERNPDSLDDLQGISGMGAKKLQAYGAEVLRVSRGG